MAWAASMSASSRPSWPWGWWDWRDPSGRTTAEGVGEPGPQARTSALTLAVTLYGITRDQDHELAMFGLVCRVAEGVLGGILFSTSGLLWLATAQGSHALDAQSAQTIGALLLRAGGWQSGAAATFFAAGSTAFCWLLWRGRMIPSPLAMLGVIGSAMILVEQSLELAGVFKGPIAQMMWIPIAVFEITVAGWFLVKGVRPIEPSHRQVSDLSS